MTTTNTRHPVARRPRIPAKDRPLNERERRFVESYLETGNGSESARRAGYRKKPSSEASRLLKRPAVARAIAAGTAEVTEKSLTTRLSRMQWLLGVRDGSITMTQAMPTGEGIQTIKCTAPPRERLKAAEILGRMMGDMVVQLDVTHSLTDLIDSVGDLGDELGAVPALEGGGTGRERNPSRAREASQ